MIVSGGEDALRRSIAVKIASQKAARVKEWDAQVPEAVSGFRLKKYLPSNWDGRIPSYATSSVLSYLDDPSKFIVLIGSQGVGKTAMGVSLARNLIVRGLAKNGLYCSAPNLLSLLSFDPGEAEKYKRCGVLLLDDVGAVSDGQLTEARRTGLWNIIDHRWSSSNLYTIITTNMPVGTHDFGTTTSLKDFFGSSAWDRITDSHTLVQFSGNSFRGCADSEDY